VTDRRYRDSVSRPIPVWNGVLDHRKRIGPALWVFLWLLDVITGEKDGVGLVLGGAPVKASKIAKGLAFDKWTVLQHLQMLEVGRYIKRRRTPYGFVIEVLNSRKFGIWRQHKRSGENPQSGKREIGGFSDSDRGKTHDPSLENPRNKEDAAVDAAITQQQPAAASLKPQDSVWGFLKIHPCGPLSFRSLLEAGWATRNGGPYSILIGNALDAWEETEGHRPTGCASLFRALSRLREREKKNPKPGAVSTEPIHAFRPEEIPA
jgi:hypothetical protein